MQSDLTAKRTAIPPTGSSTTQISTAATIPAIPPMVARITRAATVVTTTIAIMTAR